MTDSGDTWAMIHAERRDMTPLLAGLSREQWDRDTLCHPWRVRDVVGHLIVAGTSTPASFFKSFAGSGFRFDKMTQKDAARYRGVAPAELVEQFRTTETMTTHPPGPATAMLGEIVVHGEDIRRALGIVGTVPGPHLVAVAEFYKKAGFPLGVKKRIAGLRLRATDVEWTYGDGDEVAGPAASLLLAMTGRRDAVEELKGDGVAKLAARQ
jgi:uncharacterized protein (TIGR03083 family)